MFFALSKTLDILIDPLTWVVTLLGTGLWLVARDRRRRLGTALCLLGLGVLLLCSTPAVADRVWSSLESQVPSSARSDVTYDAVVLLGGVVSPLGSTPQSPAWNDSVERLLVTRELLAAGRARSVIVSGGSYSVPGLPTEAQFLAEGLEALGIAKDRIILEDKALNTRDNATLSKAIVDQRGFKTVLVVTSAFHMRRAKGCFEAVGFTADYLPVDYRVREPRHETHVLPRGEYFSDTSKAVRERVGLWVYELMGYAK